MLISYHCFESHVIKLIIMNNKNTLISTDNYASNKSYSMHVNI